MVKLLPLRVSKRHLRASVGHLRVSEGHLRVSMTQLMGSDDLFVLALDSRPLMKASASVSARFPVPSEALNRAGALSLLSLAWY